MYRLGVCIDSSIIGLSVLGMNPDTKVVRSLDKLYCRYFPNGRTSKGKSLNLNRRTKSQQRRNRKRKNQRRDQLIAYFFENKFIEKDSLDKFYKLKPLQLRAEGLERKLSEEELSRALSHLVQRRGYKGNRQEDQEAEQELKKSKEKPKDKKEESEADKKKKTLYAITQFKTKLQESKTTLGAYLYKLSQEKVDGHLRSTKANYKEQRFYDREMYEEEFKALKEAQKSFGCDWDEDVWVTIENYIFFQRPLKKPISGKCILYKGCLRAPRALPSFQRFRILQDLANLKLWDGWDKEEIDSDQKRILFNTLLKQNQANFGKLKTLLKLPKERVFNLESARKKELEGDKTSTLIAKYFGADWYDLSLFKQDSIVLALKHEVDTDILVKELKKLNLSEDQINSLLEVPVKKLPEGNCCYSQKALKDLITYMEPEFAYSTTIHRRLMPPEEPVVYDKLEYYGKIMPHRTMNFFDKKEINADERLYGKIGNPTVHIALNQLRKLINKVIERHGKPEQIVVEVSRELKHSKAVKKAINSEQTKNTKANKKIVSRLKTLYVAENPDNVKKYKLWEELHKKPEKRCCVFTGRLITEQQIFTQEVQAMKILPFSKTLNAHTSNEILVYGEVISHKGTKTPDEAFNRAGSPYKYSDIKKRIKNLPQGKQLKFRPQALGKHGYSISTHINDKAYISSVTKEYLSSICTKVWATSGELTPILRKNWGFENIFEIENDYRECAVDAAIVGMIDNSLMNLANKKASNYEDLTFEKPFPNFTGQLYELSEKLIVSHRPDHRYLNNLIQESFYSPCKPNEFVEHDPDNPIGQDYNVKIRKAIPDINQGTIGRLVCPKKRKVLLEVEWEDKTKPKVALDQYLFEKMGIRPKALKVYEKNKNIATKYFEDKKLGKRHSKVVLSGGNYGLTMWRLPIYELAKELHEDKSLFIITPKQGKHQYLFQNIFNYDINPPKPHPEAKKMLHLLRSDMVKVPRKSTGEQVIGRVVSIDHTSEQIYVVPHNDGRDSKNRERMPIRYLRMIEGIVNKFHSKELL